MSRIVKIWYNSTMAERCSMVYWVVLLIVAICAPLLSMAMGYGPNQVAADSVFYQPPLSEDSLGIHWLGTDRLGQDVLLRLIYGARTALLIGAGATIISLLIGLFLGVWAGYYGNDNYQVSISQLVGLIVYVPLSLFYLLEYECGFVYYLLAFAGGVVIYYFFGRYAAQRIKIPCDTLTMKAIEIYTTIPGLVLVFSLFAIVGRTSVWTVILILGLMSWPGKARLVRAETLHQRTKNYVKSAQMMGLSTARVIGYHILPNVFPPVMIALVFSFASTILVESTLSFLDLGLPTTVPSWGGMMRDARDYFSAWWVALFPGLLLFLTILTLNVLAQKLNKA